MSGSASGWSLRWSICAVAVLLAGNAVGGDERVTLDNLLSEIGLSSDAIDRIKAGEIVTGPMEEGIDEELAGYAIAFLRVDLEDAADGILDGVDLSHEDATVHELGDPATESFSALDFGSEGVRELVELARVEPGSEFNLSRAEIRTLEGMGLRPGAIKKDAVARDKAMDAYRDVLLGRYRVYRERGLDGIARYDRTLGKYADPANELRVALEAWRWIDSYAPEFFGALAGYPYADPEGVEHRFFCIRNEVADRPILVLNHRTVLHRPGRYTLAAERHFYVGHTYNSLQNLAVAFPVDGGTFIAFGSRIFTDRVTGAAKGLKHRIGRGRLLDAAVEYFERLKATHDSP